MVGTAHPTKNALLQLVLDVSIDFIQSYVVQSYYQVIAFRIISPPPVGFYFGRELGMGHWALGIGHWALGKLFPSP
jgi:hypothetical protein